MTPYWLTTQKWISTIISIECYLIICTIGGFKTGHRKPKVYDLKLQCYAPYLWQNILTNLTQIKQEQSASKDLFTETSAYLRIIYLAKVSTSKIIHSQFSYALTHYSQISSIFQNPNSPAYIDPQTARHDKQCMHEFVNWSMINIATVGQK